MRRRLIALALPLALLPAQAHAAPVTYSCDDGQELTVDLADAAAAKLVRGEQTWTLPAVTTDSGTSYGSEGTEFWAEGNEAILTVDGATAQCIIKPAPE